jgi:hypothetical protein
MTIVSTHYALRICNYDSKSVPSNKADGMFIRNNGGLTDSKISAKVFEDEVSAAKWFSDLALTEPLWLRSTPNAQVFVVPVVTKIVVKQAMTTGTRLR